MNPFVVACPDCLAPAGRRCTLRRLPNEDGTAVHQSRRDSARLRTAVHGTCTRCGRLMLQMSDPEETRHAQADDQGPIPLCPPIETQEAFGIVEHVRSGAAEFRRSEVQPDPPADQPNPPPPLDLPVPTSADHVDAHPCPECRQGKHPNCDGTAWDDATDQPVTCPCALDGHRG